MRIEVGPVDGEAAQCWLAHVLDRLAVVRANQHLLPFRLPEEVADDIEQLLTMWLALADGTIGGAAFHWVGILEPERVRVLVQYWANLDSMSDDLVRELGIDWSPVAARPFFVALTTAVATAMASAEGGPDPFAQLLVEHGDRPVRTVRIACGARGIPG